MCDCANNILGFQSPDKDQNTPGGALTPLWTWRPSSAGFTTDQYPTMATPVIDAYNSRMFVLYKEPNNAQLFAMSLSQSGKVPPTMLWSINLSQLSLGNNDAGQAISFKTFSEDHSIFYYGGKVWVPSQDYAGAHIVDGATGQNMKTTTSLWNTGQRLRGMVGGAAMNWRAPVFVAHGSGYGMQSFNPDTGNRSWWSDNPFDAYTEEFSHPVAVSFQNGPVTTNCNVPSDKIPIHHPPPLADPCP